MLVFDNRGRVSVAGAGPDREPGDGAVTDLEPVVIRVVLP